MNSTHTQRRRGTHGCVLYRSVFACAYTKLFVIALLSAFSLQPLAPVYANEATSTEPTAGTATQSEAPSADNEPEPGSGAESGTESETDQEKNEENESGEETQTTQARSAENESEPNDDNATEKETDHAGKDIDHSEELSASSSDDIAEQSEDDPATNEARASSTEASTAGIATTTNNESATAPAGTTTVPSDALGATTTTLSSATGSTTGAVAGTASTSAATTTSGADAADSTASPGSASDTQSGTPAGAAASSSVSSSTTPSADEEVLEAEPTASSTPSATASTESDPVVDADKSTASPEEGATSSINEHVASSTSTPVEATAFVQNDENRYQFGETECVSVGDGAFYCSEDDASAQTLEDGVYAQADEGGDREIYYREDGVAQKLTDNTYEDAAPYLDAAAEEVVFHRLINGRYQIVRHDLSSGEEVQLTDSHENSMEPAQQGGVTVWQQWVDNNWEIAVHTDDTVELLTDNNDHDVAPTVRDGYVMWHTTNSDGEKLLSVYEIATGISSTIADPDGGQVDNPRFVLVYDTTYENGDRVTKEYDPETGEVRPVGSDPAPLPVKIPEPDPSGEPRALIQNKPTNSKDELLETGSSTPQGNSAASSTGTSTPTQNAATTTTLNGDIDLAASSTEPLQLSEFDVVVTPRAGTSSREQVGTSSTTGSEGA